MNSGRPAGIASFRLDIRGRQRGILAAPNDLRPARGGAQTDGGDGWGQTGRYQVSGLAWH